MVPFDSIEGLVSLLDTRMPTAYAYYGDGEHICMMNPPVAQRTKVNGNGCAYTPALKDALVQTLVDGNLSAYALFPGKYLGQSGLDWICSNGFDRLPCTSDYIIRRAVHGGLGGGKFIASLRDKKILLVGPSFLRDLDLFDFRFIECIPVDSFNTIDTLVDAVLNECSDDQPDVVCLSMGMPAAVLADRVWVKTNKAFSILDCGSVWDGFVGLNSRGKMHMPRYQNILKKNRQEADQEMKEKYGK